MYTRTSKIHLQSSRSHIQVLRRDKRTMLNEDQCKRFEVLLLESDDIFELGRDATPYAEHFINAGDYQPISSPPYRMAL